MSELFSAKGLILRTTHIKDNDLMLTVYTEERGLISVMAKGAKAIKSKKLAATQQFCYSEFVIFERGDKLWAKEVELIDSFFGLRESLEGLALATYVAEVLCDVGTADGDRELLRLALNTVYAIADGKYDLALVKGAFEMRIAALLGFMPDVTGCHLCGNRGGDCYFDIMSGSLECFDCHTEEDYPGQMPAHESKIVRIISEGARNALAYAIYAPGEKLFSFSLLPEDAALFSSAAETYLLNHLERGFKSLDFYNEVKR